ncbi:MAG: hypothetical protein ACLFMO_08175, partial [Eubacteriales bacterium]
LYFLSMLSPSLFLSLVYIVDINISILNISPVIIPINNNIIVPVIAIPKLTLSSLYVLIAKYI